MTINSTKRMEKYMFIVRLSNPVSGEENKQSFILPGWLSSFPVYWRCLDQTSPRTPRMSPCTLVFNTLSEPYSTLGYNKRHAGRYKEQLVLRENARDHPSQLQTLEIHPIAS
jgi:hypothetical protein